MATVVGAFIPSEQIIIFRFFLFTFSLVIRYRMRKYHQKSYKMFYFEILKFPVFLRVPSPPTPPSRKGLVCPSPCPWCVMESVSIDHSVDERYATNFDEILQVPYEGIPDS